MSEIREYQRTAPVLAFQYMGEFPLDFLHQPESVKRGRDARAEIRWSIMAGGVSRCQELIVPIGHWLVREFNGALRTFSPEDFKRSYKAVIVRESD